jgi:carboxypeptidase family protein
MNIDGKAWKFFLRGLRRRLSIAVSMAPLAVLAGSLALTPSTLASVFPIDVGDFSIFIPCGDLSGNTGIGGATVSGAGRTTVSDGSGNYSIRCVPAGTYSIGVSKSGYAFTTASTTVTVAAGSGATIQTNFATCGNFSGNAGVAGASVTVAGRAAVTDSSGNYLVACVTAGTYTMTVTKAGYTFTPGSAGLTMPANASAAVVTNFTATPVPTCGNFSGNAGVAGASVAVAGQTAVTDGSGNYLVACVAAGTYTMTPTKTGYTFVPATATVSMPAASTATVVANFTALPAANTPIVAPVTLSDVLVGSEKRPGGTSGYQWIYEVDVSKLAQVPATTEHPYWYRYYRGFWNSSGQFIGNNSSGNWDAGGWTLGTTYAPEWSTIGFGGKPSNNIDFPALGNFDTRVPYTSSFNNSGAVARVYLDHHFRNSIGPGSSAHGNYKWLPGSSDLGPNYYVNGQPSSAVTHLFLIELYRKTVFEPHSATYTGAERWATVKPGEVTTDGWGIVPADSYVMDGTQGGVQWIFIKPKRAALNVRTSGATCPRTLVINEFPVEGMTPCIIDPALWKDTDQTVICTAGICKDTAGFLVKSLMDAGRKIPDGTYPNPQTVYFIASQTQEAYGDPGSSPDYTKAGKIFMVTPDGYSAEITMTQAMAMMEAWGLGFINGSINSVDAALANAATIAASKNKPLVMVYMAQDLTYPFSQGNYQSDEMFVLRTLMTHTESLGLETTWIGHSWSAHLVMSAAAPYSRINVALVNPAQAPYSDVRSAFLSNIQNYRGPSLTILAGGMDWVSINGQGQWVPQNPNCACGPEQSADIKAALDAQPGNRKQVVIGDRYNPNLNSQLMVKHGMRDMIANGAGAYIPLPPRQY